MIGDNIKKIREAYGCTQEEFAAKLGTTRSVITNLEYSKLQSPEKKMPLFRLISEKFNVPLDWILADDPGPVPMPELDEAQREVAKIGEIVKSEDPFFQAFLRWYGQRTKAERQDICKYVLDFAEKLKEAQK